MRQEGMIGLCQWIISTFVLCLSISMLKGFYSILEHVKGRPLFYSSFINKSKNQGP